MSTKKDSAPQKHHWIVSGLIIFSTEGETVPHSIPLNGVLIQDGKNLTVRSINKAQMLLQAGLHQQLPGVKYTVHNVVLQNAIYCGYMTEAEWKDGVDIPQAANEPSAEGQDIQPEAQVEGTEESQKPV